MGPGAETPGPSSPLATNCLEGSEKEKQVEFSIPCANSGEGIKNGNIFIYATNDNGLPMMAAKKAKKDPVSALIKFMVQE